MTPRHVILAALLSLLFGGCGPGLLTVSVGYAGANATVSWDTRKAEENRPANVEQPEVPVKGGVSGE